MDTLIPILGAGVFLIVLERIIPDQKLPHVDGWWFRVVVINILQLGVVALAFKTFRDGRAYSNARRLRERNGYKGELRTIGNVLRDQYLFMQRCGFDALEVKECETEQDWQRATGAITVFYQPAADGRETVIRKRHSQTS